MEDEKNSDTNVTEEQNMDKTDQEAVAGTSNAEERSEETDNSQNGRSRGKKKLGASTEAGPSKVRNALAVSSAMGSDTSSDDDGPQARKRERQDDDTTETESNNFPQLRSRTNHRCYRSHHDEADSDNETAFEPTSSLSSESASSDESMDYGRVLEFVSRPLNESRLFDSDDTVSVFDSDDSLDLLRNRYTADTDVEDNEENIKYQGCLQKEKPKHKWSITKEVIHRQMGLRTNQQEPELFGQHCYSSLHCVERLELLYKLKEHTGCVNTIQFNDSGTRMVSGSDDRKIVVWDWAVARSVLSFNSKHNSNIFQVKFLPLLGDTHIASCARDGQVRLSVLSSSGECRIRKKLAQHSKPAMKLALQPDSAHTFLSCGKDARVMSIDIRESQQKTLVCVKEDNAKVALCCVDTNPFDCNEFCASGLDNFVRVYDKRKINRDGQAMKKFCPHHLQGNMQRSTRFVTITCALYNHDGTEILASYNDESVYLFDARHSDGAEFVHKYEGHRNSLTEKWVNFYGPNSEYIMSGSDCGNIFIWDKNTEAVVQLLRGDEEGVVNGLVGHPQLPVLATCGFDSDIKIWIPSCEHDPELKELKKVVTNNIRDRMRQRPVFLQDFERLVEPPIETVTFFREALSQAVSSRLSNASNESEDSDNGDAERIQCRTS